MWQEPDSFPAPPRHVRQRALARLRRAIEDERRRRRTGRRRRRLVVSMLAVLFTVGISPAGPSGEIQPLLGLAEAVAQAPRPLGPAARHWYTRSEKTELISVPVWVGREITLQFLMATVEETWHDGGDAPRRSLTYGAPRFFSSEDEDAFNAAGLGSIYAEGRTVRVRLRPDDYRFVDRVVVSAPEELTDAMRRRVAGLGDRRLEEVGMLRLAADMIQLHGHDPLVRAQILRVIADIPGIMVMATPQTVSVSIDYLDGDQPLRLAYEFDADTAHLVGEQLAALATVSEPGYVLRSARHSMLPAVGFSES